MKIYTRFFLSIYLIGGAVGCDERLQSGHPSLVGGGQELYLSLEACSVEGNGSLELVINNLSNDVMRVPADLPRVGCCDSGGISVFLANNRGQEIQRCGFIDAFGLGGEADLPPRRSRKITISGQSLAAGYCKDSLVGEVIVASYGDTKSIVRSNPVRIDECRN